MFLGELDGTLVGNTINIDINSFTSIYVELSVATDSLFERIPLKYCPNIVSMQLTERNGDDVLQASVSLSGIKSGNPRVLLSHGDGMWGTLIKIRFYGAYFA